MSNITKIAKTANVKLIIAKTFVNASTLVNYHPMHKIINITHFISSMRHKIKHTFSFMYGSATSDISPCCKTFSSYEENKVYDKHNKICHIYDNLHALCIPDI